MLEQTIKSLRQENEQLKRMQQEMSFALEKLKRQTEAHAREVLIEASLERVRAKTMAMHSSQDVSEATATMFTELEKLGIETVRCGIAIIDESRTMEVWSVTNVDEGKKVMGAGILDMRTHPLWQLIFEEWEKNSWFLYYFLAGKEKEDYINIINATINYLSEPILELPDMNFQGYYFGDGAIWAYSLKPHSEEDKEVMKKFTSVFSLTFRRYRDLQIAETNAREATIEAALEKVRGKALAMHQSDELQGVVNTVIETLKELNIKIDTTNILILKNDASTIEFWTGSNSTGKLYTEGWKVPYGNIDYFKRLEAAACENSPQVYQVTYQFAEKNELFHFLFEHTDFKDLREERKKFVLESEIATFGIAVINDIGIQMISYTRESFSEKELEILGRFAQVFTQAYIRFLDLQKAEANAREATKQAALDRVRAEIASMRTVIDLERITPIIWKELTILGVPFIRCGVFIMDVPDELIHTFLSTPDGKAIAAFHLPFNTPGNIGQVYLHWKDKKTYVSHWDEVVFTEFAETLVRQGALSSSEQYLKTIPHGGFHLHFLPFLQGMLYVGNTTQLPEEEIKLIQSVANAFSTAYARYEDFNKLETAKQQLENTLSDLKQAQQLLVQSEKMASLGELTAGIAHEIQNPLNFVNNFSEVSNELLDEMKVELINGNDQNATLLADDVKENLQKILHHGKRADAIVKGMLQHSRSSTGQKEQTDINALADEYLRLSFHGHRSKDKSFNALLKTDFDDSIGTIPVIPQDIGRVLLNLYNNAFYAAPLPIKDSHKNINNKHDPTIWVSTRKMNDKILISVRDNGPGIPEKIMEKIFQPFFTTKPTGQGTGLGLSLSYDIIKAHGGELMVETKEGEGAKFTIQLPII